MEGTSLSSSTTDDYDEAIFCDHDEDIYALHDDDEDGENFFGENIFSISDEKYSEEVEFHDNDEDGENIFGENIFSTSDEKYSEEDKQSYCAICMEAKPIEEMFKNQNCSHSFCEECVGTYLAAKIQENISMVTCPEPKCNAILDPNDCSSIISKEVFDRWGNALCENLVISSQKFYCPFSDCSAMLVNDESEVVTVSECPHCHRLFCAQCKVTWHVGVDCGEFQSLKDVERGREDLMAMELIKNKRWKRCPKCSFYVERTEGCTHISCRCGNHFCYDCGSDLNMCCCG